MTGNDETGGFFLFAGSHVWRLRRFLGSFHQVPLVFQSLLIRQRSRVAVYHFHIRVFQLPLPGNNDPKQKNNQNDQTILVTQFIFNVKK